jgi:hypothetical protein
VGQLSKTDTRSYRDNVSKLGERSACDNGVCLGAGAAPQIAQAAHAANSMIRWRAKGGMIEVASNVPNMMGG